MVNTAEPTMRALTGPVVVCPVLVRVKVATELTVFCSTPLKSNEVRFNDRAPAVIPVPARVAMAVPPVVAPALTVTVPLLRPTLVGAKRTDSVQLPLAGIAAVQPL